MAIQQIRLFGDPVLRTPAIEVVDFDKELRTLVADLQDTMLAAPGVGLAAPQIGVGLRVFAYHVDGVLGHLVNPSLPVLPGRLLRHAARAARGGQGLEHARRAGRDRGQRAPRPVHPA